MQKQDLADHVGDTLLLLRFLTLLEVLDQLLGFCDIVKVVHVYHCAFQSLLVIVGLHFGATLEKLQLKESVLRECPEGGFIALEKKLMHSFGFSSEEFLANVIKCTEILMPGVIADGETQNVPSLRLCRSIASLATCSVGIMIVDFLVAWATISIVRACHVIGRLVQT